MLVTRALAALAVLVAPQVAPTETAIAVGVAVEQVEASTVALVSTILAPRLDAPRDSSDWST